MARAAIAACALTTESEPLPNTLPHLENPEEHAPFDGTTYLSPVFAAAPRCSDFRIDDLEPAFRGLEIAASNNADPSRADGIFRSTPYRRPD